MPHCSVQNRITFYENRLYSQTSIFLILPTREYREQLFRVFKITSAVLHRYLYAKPRPQKKLIHTRRTISGHCERVRIPMYEF